MYCLTPEEIRCLDKVQGHRIDDAAFANNDLISKFRSQGLLCVGTTEQSLECSDMTTIRRLLKEKGLKAGGKKVDLIQRVLKSYSYTELECADIPKRFILTDEGVQVIDKNKALLLYFKAFGSTDTLDPGEIISYQCSHPKDSEYDILVELFKERIAKVKGIGEKRSTMAVLCRLYMMKHDDALVCETEREIERLDKLWEEEREQQMRKYDPILGLSLEERRRIQQEAIDEMDDEWEKELDRKNRAKAGIEEG